MRRILIAAIPAMLVFVAFWWVAHETMFLLDRAAQLEIRLTVAEARLTTLESGRIDVPIPRTFAREVTP